MRRNKPRASVVGRSRTMGGPKNAPNEGHSSPAPVGLFIGVFVVLGRRLRLGGGDPRGRRLPGGGSGVEAPIPAVRQKRSKRLSTSCQAVAKLGTNASDEGMVIVAMALLSFARSHAQ